MFLVCFTGFRSLTLIVVLCASSWTLSRPRPISNILHWVHEQGLKTNQGSSSSKTLMMHSLNKEASQLLCDAVRCRVEDGDATAECWTDGRGKELAPDRFWNSGIESMIAGDDEGPCMGIELNIWERTKVISPCYAFFLLLS
jgi:hypothetical protein